MATQERRGKKQGIDLGSILQLFSMFSPNASQTAQLGQQGQQFQQEQQTHQMDQQQRMQQFAQEMQQRMKEHKASLAELQSSHGSENDLKKMMLEYQQQNQKFQQEHEARLASLQEHEQTQREGSEADRNALEIEKLNQAKADRATTLAEMQSREKTDLAKVFALQDPELAQKIAVGGPAAIQQHWAEKAAVKQQQLEVQKSAARILQQKGKTAQAELLLKSTGMAPEEVQGFLSAPPPTPSGTAPVPTLPVPGQPLPTQPKKLGTLGELTGNGPGGLDFDALKALFNNSSLSDKILSFFPEKQRQ